MKIYSIITLIVFPLFVFAQNSITVKVGDEMAYEEMYISLNGGCSLACGIGWDVSATSTLPSQTDNSYVASNVDDGKRETAWVEGKKGYGVGESIIVEFKGSPDLKDVPFRGFIITNGYAKNEQTWTLNSRVKTFEVVLNGEPQFLVNIEDSMYPQWVNFGLVLQVSPKDKVAFVIKDVYKGEKYTDTAISDLSLNGAH